MQKIISLLAIIIIPLLHTSLPQDLPGTFLNNNIFLEALGEPYAVSLNYEKVFGDQLAIRGGIGWAPVLDFLDDFENDSVVPIIAGVSYLIPIYKQYKIEFGANISKDIINTSHYEHLTGVLGYRFQLREQGVLVRISVTPTIPLDRSGVYMLYGISLGFNL